MDNLNDGKVNISINKNQTGELIPQGSSIPSIEAMGSERISEKNKAIQVALIQAGQQAIQQGIQTHAQLSGNTTLTTLLNNGTNLSADALSLMQGGILGGIVVGTKYALGAYQAYADAIVQNRQIEFEKQRLGTISREGSRYW